MSNQLYRAFGTLLFVTAVSGNATSQRNITHQKVIWYAYLNSIEINSKVKFVSEIHERRYFNPDAQHQFALRERIHVALNQNIDIAICFAYFLQSPNNPYSTSNLKIPELRPHGDLTLLQPFNRFTVQHRFRVEYRFFRNTFDNALVSGYNSNMRFRYQLGVELPLYKFKNEGDLKLKFGDEIFINAGKNIQNNVFDHNRYYFAILLSPIKSLTFEAGYMNWFQQLPSGTDYYERDIIRLSITQRLICKPKKVNQLK
jgi:hypothetical protein